MRQKKPTALAYLDTNVVLDMLAPTRKNPAAQELLRILRTSRDVKGVVSSFCAFEVIDALQLGIYYHRAVETEFTLEEARKLKAGPIDRSMLEPATQRLGAFLKQNSNGLLLMDPDANAFWHRAASIAMKSRFEASDLCHVALAIGVGASSLITNDEDFYDSMIDVTSRHMGFTPIRCSPKTEPARLRSLLASSKRRAGRKADEVQAQGLTRITGLLNLVTGGAPMSEGPATLSNKLDSLERTFARSSKKMNRPDESGRSSPADGAQAATGPAKKKG